MKANLIWGRGDRLVVLTVILLFLTACAPATAETTEMATLQTSAAVSETLEPTRTLSVIKTHTPTVPTYPTETPFPFPTPQVDNTQDLRLWGISPNDEWLAWTICCLEIGPYLLVQNIANDVEWTVTFDFAERFWWEGGMGPVAWSTDENYFFFKIRAPSDGMSTPDSAAFLRRLDLSTGEVTDLIDTDEFTFFAFSISKIHQKLVYIPNSSSRVEVYVRDLGTGIESHALVAEYQDLIIGHIDNIVWSVNESQIVFSVEKWESDPGVEIILFDVDDLSSRTILEFVLEYPRPVDWISEDEILLDMGFDTFSLNLLNINTGELISATPQP